MDRVRWTSIRVRKGFRVLQFVLGLTECGLYAAPARSGCALCAYAVVVGSLSVLTVVGSGVIGFWDGRWTALFIWEAILFVLWIGNSAVMQTDPSANGVVGIDWFNAFLWLATTALTGFFSWSRGGFRIARWRSSREGPVDDIEAPGDWEDDYFPPPNTDTRTGPIPQDFEHSDQECFPAPEYTQRNKDILIEVLRRYHEVLEERQTQQQFVQLRTELTDAESGRQRYSSEQRLTNLFTRASRLSELQSNSEAGDSIGAGSTDTNGSPTAGPSEDTTPANEELRGCNICIEDVPSVSGFPAGPVTANCSHPALACLTCIATSIRTNLDNNAWNDIRCPECNETLDYGDIRRFADPETFARYDQYSIRAALNADPQFRWCRGPHCEAGQLHEGGEAQPIVTCVRCGFRTCFRHQEPWHEDISCDHYDALKRNPDNFLTHVEIEEEAAAATFSTAPQHHQRRVVQRASQRQADMDAAAAAAAARRRRRVAAIRQKARDEEASAREVGRSCKPCPGCKRPIQKKSGCDHMRCSQCRYEFCYQCLANYERIRWFGNRAHRSGCAHHR